MARSANDDRSIRPRHPFHVAGGFAAAVSLLAMGLVVATLGTAKHYSPRGGRSPRCCSASERSKSKRSLLACTDDGAAVRLAVANDQPIPLEILKRLADKHRDPSPIGPIRLTRRGAVADSSKKNRCSCCPSSRETKEAPDRSIEKSAAASTELVYGLFARQCSGDSNAWKLGFVAMVVPPARSPIGKPHDLTSVLANRDVNPFGYRTPPPMPPPRRLSAATQQPAV